MSKLNLEERKHNYDALFLLVEQVLPAPWSTLMSTLKKNTDYEGTTYLGLRDAPAAKANHHAYKGGLIAHYLEMWAIYKSLDMKLIGQDPMIADDSILKGIILHDLHKGWCNFVEDSAVPSGLNYGKHPSSSLLTQDQKTVYIASKYVTLDLLQLNAVYHSEGGWAASPPKWSSVLAKLLYLLDEFSSNVKDRTMGSSPEGTVTSVQVFGDKGVTTAISLPLDLGT